MEGTSVISEGPDWLLFSRRALWGRGQEGISCIVREREGREASKGQPPSCLELGFHSLTQLNRLFFLSLHCKHSSLHLHCTLNPKVGPLSAHPSHQPVPVAMETIWGKVISLYFQPPCFQHQSIKPPNPISQGEVLGESEGGEKLNTGKKNNSKEK